MEILCRTNAESDADKVVTKWGSLTWLASNDLGNCQEMTLGRVVIKKGMKNPRHTHGNCVEILYLLKGKLEHTLEDKSVVMNPGDTLIAPAGLMHNAINIGDEDADMMVIYSDGSRGFELEQ